LLGAMMVIHGDHGPAGLPGGARQVDGRLPAIGADLEHRPEPAVRGRRTVQGKALGGRHEPAGRLRRLPPILGPWGDGARRVGGFRAIGVWGVPRRGSAPPGWHSHALILPSAARSAGEILGVATVEGAAMRVTVDPDLCEANGVCANLVPQVFDLDDEDVL